MKLLIVLGLAFGAIVGFPDHTRGGDNRPQSAVSRKKSTVLDVVLATNKRIYKRNEVVRLQVMLINPRSKPIYVFATLGWGLSSSLTLNLRDALGKQIDPEFFPDAQTYASPNDKSAFVKLSPNHFVGASFPASIEFLNFTRPGKYTIFVEYNSPFSVNDVELSPFWGKENGTIKSNVVYVEVVR